LLWEASYPSIVRGDWSGEQFLRREVTEMPTDIGSQITAAIQALNTGELTQIVRAASGDDSAVALLGWDCKPLQALSVGNGTIGF